MIQVRLTPPTPLNKAVNKDLTAALERIDDKTVLTSRSPTAGEIFFDFPTQANPILNTLGELFLKWVRDPSPPIIAYNMVLE